MLIENLANEVLPPANRDAWMRTGETSFDHTAGGPSFIIRLVRIQSGIRIYAELIESIHPNLPVDSAFRSTRPEGGSDSMVIIEPNSVADLTVDLDDDE